MNKFVAEGKYGILKSPNQSDWQCHLFGAKSTSYGITYRPVEGNVPNWFVRWMMKICLGCTWVRDKKPE